MMTRISLFIIPVIFATAAPLAAAGRLVVVAGGGDGSDGTPAADAKLVSPFGIDFADGRTYFVEFVNGERLRAIDEKGIIQTLAGTGTKGFAGDGGPGPKAAVNGMHSLAVGPDGIVYLADTFNRRIRTCNPKTTIVTTFAGTGDKGFAGDGGTADQAKFGDVYCLAFDDKKANLYVADLDNRRIRKIDMKTRIVSTHAGNGTKGVPTDGAMAIDSPLVDPRAVTVAPDGSVFIVERSGHALRKVDSAGRISTVAGTSKAGAAIGDGSALKVQFNGPKHLCIEPHDKTYSVLIADTENHRILRYSSDAKVVVVAGTGKKGATLVDGDPLKSELSQPHGVAVHPKTGEIYIADSSNQRILKIATTTPEK